MRTLGLGVFLSTVCLLSTGCAKVQQEMTIESTPPGALVFLNGQEVGRTPLKRDFKWYGDYDVRLQLEGYQTLKTHKAVTAPWWNWVPFDLVANFMPFTIRDEQRLAFELKPADPTLDQPIGLLTRAHELRGDLEGSEFTRAATRPATTKPATTTTTTAPAK
ncbi:MAG: PEGA domain-containing protein [Phycisphaerae bacterium]|nr:PEGA domain-containing protein [Tepidisphaeraceae bacterium]